MRRNETAYPIWIKFCTLAGTPELMMPTNFGDDRLKRLGTAYQPENACKLLWPVLINSIAYVPMRIVDVVRSTT